MEELNAWAWTLVSESAEALLSALSGLFWPMIFFAGLALLIRRGKVVEDIRRVMPETSINFGLMAFNVLITVPLLTAGSVILVWISSSALPQVLSESFWPHLPGVVVILLAVTIGDFVGYWRHRFEHTRFLWPSHAVHHSDTEMTWFALERFHPINRATTYAIDSGALLLLGFPTEAIIANGLVRHYYGFFIHADLPWTYGPVLGKDLRLSSDAPVAPRERSRVLQDEFCHGVFALGPVVRDLPRPGSLQRGAWCIRGHGFGLHRAASASVSSSGIPAQRSGTRGG